MGTSVVDDILGGSPSPSSSGSHVVDSILSDSGASHGPGLVDNILSGTGKVLGALGSGEDWIARKSAQLQGLPVADDATIGQMLRSGVGLNQGDEGYAGKLGGKAVEFAGDLARDPLAWTGLGLEGTAGKLAAGGLAAQGGIGAYQEGKQAYNTIQKEGFTPKAAEQVLGAGLSAGMAGLAGTHALSKEPTPTPEAVPEAPQAPGTGLGANQTLQAPPAITEAAPDAHEAEVLVKSGTLNHIPDDELARRELFYKNHGMTDSLAATQAEIQSRSGALPAEPLPEGAPAPPPVEPAPALPPFSAEAGPGQSAGAPVVPEPLPAEPLPERAPDRREAEQPVAEDRRLSDRRTQVASELGLPEDNPAVVRTAQAEHDANTDPLTGLGNKRQWQTIEPTLDKDNDHVVYVDLKKFKPLNDTYGHDVGDVVLQAVGDVMREHLGDETARVGGDEFTGVLRGHTLEEAKAKAAKLQEAIKAEPIAVQLPDGRVVEIPPVEAHIGVGRNATEADLAANANAAESRKGGRGALPPESGAESGVPGGSEGGGQGTSEGAQAVQPQADKLAALGWTPEQLRLANPSPERLQEILDKGEGPAYTPDGTRALPTNHGGRMAENIPPADLAERQTALAEKQAPLVQAAGEEANPAFGGKGEVIPGADAARQRILDRAAQLGKGSANFGLLDVPGSLADHALVGADFIAKGLRDFGTWSGRMLSEFGDAIKPHLQAIWETAKQTAKDFAYTFAGKGEQPGEFSPAETGALKIGPKDQPVPVEPEPEQPKAKPIPPGKPIGNVPSPEANEIPPPASLGEKAREAWKAGLLSGPQTSIVKATGDMIRQGLSLAETAFTSHVTEPLLAKAQGRDVERYKGEAAASFAAVRAKAPEVFGKMFGDLKDAFTFQNEKPRTDSAGLELPAGAIPGKAGTVIRTPFRVFEAVTDAFKGLAGEQELYKQALRLAKGDPDQASALVTKFNALSDEQKASLYPDMAKSIDKAQKDMTYQGPYDESKAIEGMAQFVSKAATKYPMLDLIFPFRKVPAKIATATLERSPWGFKYAYDAYKDFKAGKISAGEVSDALTKPMLGTAAMMTFGAAAKAGMMTGAGPTDLKKKMALEATGWRPYSFVIPGSNGPQYIAYNRFEPVSSLLGVAADLAESGKEKDVGSVVDKIGGSILDNMINKSFLTGLENASLLLSDPKRYAGQVINQTASGLVPNILAKTAQAIDPTVRDVKGGPGLEGFAEGIGKTLVSRIPFASEELAAKRTATGEPMERPGSALERFASPATRSETIPGTEVNKFLVDEDAVPGAASRTFTVPGTHGKQVQLSDSELKILQDAAQQASKYVQQNYMNSPRFKTLDPEEQKRLIESAFTNYRNAARDKLMNNYTSRARFMRDAVAPS